MISFSYLKNRSLSDLTALTPSDGAVVIGDGSKWVSESGATARTSLGVGTGDSPTFAGLDLTGITNSNIPYMSASGFANSPINIDTSVVIGGTSQFSIDTLSVQHASDCRFTVGSLTAGHSVFRVISNNANGVYFDAITNDFVTPKSIYIDPNAGGVAIGGTTLLASCGLSVQSAADCRMSIGSNTAGHAVMRIISNNADYISIDSMTSNFVTPKNICFQPNGGNIGIGESAPVTLTEWTHTEPYLTLHNSTHEDEDGGRESRIIARGEQTGGEETILGWLEFSHDGAADDQKGQFTIMLNDGDDSTTPSITGLNIDSSGITSVRNLYPQADDTYYLGKNDDDTPFGWKGLILKDTNDGKHYRIQLTNGAIDIVDLTD